MTGPRVIVVGGGVVGLSCAYYLARGGADVLVLERDRIGAGASSGNAGTIAAGHPPLNRPGRVRQAIIQMLDPSSPLYVKPRWDPALWGWLVQFARHCTHEHVDACMRVMGPLGLESIKLFDSLVEEEGIDCSYRKEGHYDVCLSSKGLAAATEEAHSIRGHGYGPEVVDGDELRRREPAFGQAPVGGVYYPESATLDPARFLHQLADAFRAHGGEVREGATVGAIVVHGTSTAGVQSPNGDLQRADAVVLATGPFSLAMSRSAGLELPVQPGKGYHRDVEVGAGAAPDLRVSCVIHERSVFCTRMNGFVRLAGTMEFSGLNHVLRRQRLEQLTRGAKLVFPDFGDAAPMSEWCGLRPMAPDGLPIVGPVPGLNGMYIATGHGMLGLTLGPVTGTLIAKDVLSPEETSRFQELRPGRFA